MTRPTPTSRELRELAHREGNGLEVTLFWQPLTNELSVCVCDHVRGAYFEICPPPGAALDAFKHPYSYAARSEVYFEDERLAA